MSNECPVQNAFAVQELNLFPINHPASPLRNPQPNVKGRSSANIGKQRALAGPILSSPARQGHQLRMAEIFSKAKTQRDSMSDISAAPGRSYSSTRLSIMESSEVRYPALPLVLGLPRSLGLLVTTNEAKSSHEVEPLFPRLTTTHDSVLGFSPQRGQRLCRETETHKTVSPRFYPQRAVRCDAAYSAETFKPERYYASLGGRTEAALSDTALSEASSEHTGSSASWTGDSEFYYPKPQPLPQQQRQCSVSAWLQQLPEKLEIIGNANEDKEEDEDEAPMSPLSPNVELERGTVRRRRIEKQVRKRCVSYDDEDIFDVEN